MFMPKPHYFVVLLLRRPGLKSIYNQILYIFNFIGRLQLPLTKGNLGKRVAVWQRVVVCNVGIILLNVYRKAFVFLFPCDR